MLASALFSNAADGSEQRTQWKLQQDNEDTVSQPTSGWRITEHSTAHSVIPFPVGGDRVKPAPSSLVTVSVENAAWRWSFIISQTGTGVMVGGEVGVRVLYGRALMGCFGVAGSAGLLDYQASQARRHLPSMHSHGDTPTAGLLEDVVAACDPHTPPAELFQPGEQLVCSSRDAATAGARHGHSFARTANEYENTARGKIEPTTVCPRWITRVVGCARTLRRVENSDVTGRHDRVLSDH